MIAIVTTSFSADAAPVPPVAAPRLTSTQRPSVQPSETGETRGLSSDDSNASWKLRPKPGLPQLDSGQCNDVSKCC